MKNLNLAEEFYYKSLNIFIVVFGETHTSVAIIYNDLADLYN